MKLFSLTAAVCLLAATAHANHCQQYTEQNDIDECYMKIALDYALLHNPRFPFGALVVDHTQNEISCFGANSNRKNKLLHGETAAFWNCTELYPSPTNDDMSDPGLDWSHQTLYTTGEPCPMCAAQSIYRGVARVVWGTSIPDINRSGRQQLMIRMDDVIASARLGGNRPDHRVPVTQGGVLKDECDHAFWCSFSNFRDQEYHQSMIEEDQQVFIAKRDNDYQCVNVPFRKKL
ncbi:cytidine deaminase-like protein [Radiomyces spectabilis]|uniref:cytidine deaminase-like protein n=1 Tax=Radiomyces spectabilis TaxID=64574 RepID=UPI00221EB6AB|nr:cytidine deaminase-like protein [Radiomyces spectabilis]KAI8393334.1 cytidine deaminase-like protein [Radiomyces spectabilis]